MNGFFSGEKAWRFWLGGGKKEETGFLGKLSKERLGQTWTSVLIEPNCLVIHWDSQKNDWKGPQFWLNQHFHPEINESRKSNFLVFITSYCTRLMHHYCLTIMIQYYKTGSFSTVFELFHRSTVAGVSGWLGSGEDPRTELRWGAKKKTEDLSWGKPLETEGMGQARAWLLTKNRYALD